MAITVSIVEDNANFRVSLEQVISRSAELTCISSNRNAERALRVIPPLKPDVVLMDITLPKLSGIECTLRLKQQLPETSILILTVHADAEKIFQALKAGASGYLLKRSTSEEIIAAIHAVHTGGAPMTAEIARIVVDFFQSPEVGSNAEFRALSRRETETLNLLCEGYASKEIAAVMGVSYKTVCGHIEEIYQKLHVHSRAAAVAKCLSDPKYGRQFTQTRHGVSNA